MDHIISVDSKLVLVSDTVLYTLIDCPKMTKVSGSLSIDFSMTFNVTFHVGFESDLNHSPLLFNFNGLQASHDKKYIYRKPRQKKRHKSYVF